MKKIFTSSLFGNCYHLNSCISYDFSCHWKTNFIKIINIHCFGFACCCSYRMHCNGNKLMSYKLKIAKVLITAEKIYTYYLFLLLSCRIKYIYISYVGKYGAIINKLYFLHGTYTEDIHDRLCGRYILIHSTVFLSVLTSLFSCSFNLKSYW